MGPIFLYHFEIPQKSNADLKKTVEHLKWSFAEIVHDLLARKKLDTGFIAVKIHCKELRIHPAGIYLLKVDNRITRTRREICSKLIIKTLERGHCRRSGVFVSNFGHISHLDLVHSLLTLNM